MAALQDLRIANKPAVDKELIPDLLRRFWGLVTGLESIRALDSYDDANFYVEAASEDNAEKKNYLLKFYNAIETRHPEFLSALSTALLQLSKKHSKMVNAGVKVPNPVKLAHDKKDFVIIDCTTSNGHHTRVAVRLFDWIDGETLNSHANSVTASTFFQVGETLNKMQDVFAGIDEPEVLARQHLWDLQQFHLSFELLPFMDDVEIQGVIQAVKHMYDEAFAKLQLLPKNVIMGDANDANIIVQRRSTAAAEEKEEKNKQSNPFTIVGIIDFSDTMYTWRINEIAIAMAYGLVTPYAEVDDLTVISALFLGYCNGGTMTHPTDEEIEFIPLLMAVRLCISVMVGAYTVHRNPSNEYLLLHAAPARRALQRWYQLIQDGTAHMLLSRLESQCLELLGEDQRLFLELAKDVIADVLAAEKPTKKKKHHVVK